MFQGKLATYFVSFTDLNIQFHKEYEEPIVEEFSGNVAGRMK